MTGKSVTVVAACAGCGQATGLPLDHLTAKAAEAPRSRAAACGRRLRREAPLTSEERHGHTARRHDRHPTAVTRAPDWRGSVAASPRPHRSAAGYLLPYNPCPLSSQRPDPQYTPADGLPGPSCAPAKRRTRAQAAA
nr:hypothetical protein Ade03nite_24390 [Actinoplanes derwentensis]